MLKNEIYNLMETASVLSKGPYMRRADEEQLQRILNHLKQHFDKEVEFKLTG